MPIGDRLMLFQVLVATGYHRLYSCSPDLTFVPCAGMACRRDEVHDGKPAHLLVFGVPMPPSAGKQMTTRHYTGQIIAWIGIDGVPVAVRNVVAVKGRKLLISIEFGNTTDYRSGVIGTRLVVLSRRSEETHSVFGKAGSRVTDAVLAPMAATESGAKS